MSHPRSSPCVTLGVAILSLVALLSTFVPAATAQQPETVSIGLTSGTALVIAQPNNADWAEFVVTILKNDLPVLEELVGIDWPLDLLTVQESAEPGVAGFSGRYDHSTKTIQMGDSHDRDVLLHELAHAWFNASFSHERWIREGLAEEFAHRTVQATGGSRGTPLWPDPTYSDRVLLSEWRHTNLVPESQAGFEAYHYNASWWVMRQISTEIGLEAFSEVLVAFDDRLPGSAERQWLTLYELVDASASSPALDDIFVTYVAPVELEELETRRQVLRRYAEMFDNSDLQPPQGLQDQMAQWQWDRADALLNEAEAVLPLLAEFEARAGESSITSGDQRKRLRSARQVSQLQELAEDLVSGLATFDELDADRKLVQSEGQKHGITIDFDSGLSLTKSQTQMYESRWAIQDLTEDRHALASDAAQAGFEFTFNTDVTLAQAQDDLDVKRDELDIYLAQRTTVDDRTSQLGLAAPALTVPADIPGATTILDVQMATLDALVAAQGSVDDLGAVQKIGLFGDDLDAELLLARQAFESGTFSEASSQAGAVTLAASDARDRGMGRILIVGISVIGLLLAAVVTIGLRDSRRRA